jgi:hypothetical protein
VNHVAVGIESAEETVGNGDCPNAVLQRLPSSDDFGAGNLGALACRSLVDDGLIFRRAAARYTPSCTVMVSPG